MRCPSDSTGKVRAAGAPRFSVPWVASIYRPEDFFSTANATLTQKVWINGGSPAASLHADHNVLINATFRDMPRKPNAAYNRRAGVFS